jgi:hypothetical protein
MVKVKTNPIHNPLKIFLPVLLLFVSFQAFSQEGELPEEQILIQKDRKIVLPEIAKPQEKVLNTLKPLPKVSQKYTYSEFGVTLPLIDPKIQAPVYRPEAELPVRQGFVRLGLGNYGSTNLDAWYNSGRRKDFSYGLNLHHLASANGPVSNAGFSNNELGLNGTYYTPSFNLAGNLRYNRNRYNFYGYDQERFSKRTADTTKQIFNSVWFRLDLIGKQKTNDKLSWQGGMNLGNIADRFKASESEVLLDFKGNYKISDSSSVRLFSDFSLLKRSDSASQNRVLWRMEPMYRFGYSGFRLDAGFQISLASEPVLAAANQFKEQSAFHFHPKINIELGLAQEKLLAFAGVGGGINRKSFRDHVGMNPFLMPDVYIRHENQLFDVFFGLKGQYKGMLQYHTKASYEKLGQQAFYLNSDSVSREKFSIVYDSSSTKRFSWESELVYDPGTGAKAGMRFTYFNYGLGTLKEAWHLPSTVFSVFGSRAIADNLNLSGEFYYMGGIKALNPRSLATEKLPGMADLNLKAEYLFKTRYSAYIAVHNLLNNKNPRYLFYPSQGLRIMIGASAFF